MKRSPVTDTSADTCAAEELFRATADDIWRYVRRRVGSEQDADDITAETLTVTDGVVSGIQLEFRPKARLVSYTSRVTELGTPVVITRPAGAPTP